MCITLEPATLASTILLAHQVEHEGKTVNVVGYQNHAKSKGPGPNAMILPIPSAIAMTPANCIDMTGAEKVFRKYEEVVRPRSRGLSKGAPAAAAVDSLQVFDSGSYTVLLTKQLNLTALRQAMEALPEDKRLELSFAQAKVFSAFRKLYPDWHVAICIWKGEIDPEPILWWYEPMTEFVDKHFLPGLDAHDGNPPDPSLKSVPIDHTLITSVAPTRDWRNADEIVDGAPEHLRKWLPRHVTGALLHGQQARNGDWVFPKNIDNGFQLGGKRVPPPGYEG
jgi:hypothetical protein